MKKWKVSFVLNSSPSYIHTTVEAKTYGDAKQMIEGQYGASLRSISSIVEIK